MNPPSIQRFPMLRKKLFAALVLAAGSSLMAADLTWTGASSGTWDTSTANWSGTSTTFTSGDNAIFSGTPTTNVTAATGLTIGSINLQSGFTGTVALTGANTVTGTTTVTAGTLNLGNGGALGSSAVTLAGGTVAATATITTTNGFVAQTGTTSNLSSVGGNWSFNGNLTGSGNINRTYISGSPVSLFMGGNNSGYTGTFTMTNNANAVVRFTNANAGGAAAKWVFNQASNNTRTTLDFGTGTIQFGSFTGNGFLNSNTSGAKTIEVGALGLNETFSGQILNTAGSSSIIVTKVGTGTWTLSGSNSYTGATKVNAGTLALGAAGRISDSSALVLGGGTFATGGFDETLSTLTVSSASIVDFGSSNTSDLVFADSSGLSWSGTLTLLNFNIGADTLRFGTSISALTVDQLSKIQLAGYTASLNSSGFVTFSAIPEPSAFGTLAGLAGLGAVGLRRRRK